MVYLLWGKNRLWCALYSFIGPQPVSRSYINTFLVTIITPSFPIRGWSLNHMGCSLGTMKEGESWLKLFFLRSHPQWCPTQLPPEFTRLFLTPGFYHVGSETTVCVKAIQLEQSSIVIRDLSRSRLHQLMMVQRSHTELLYRVVSTGFEFISIQYVVMDRVQAPIPKERNTGPVIQFGHHKGGSPPKIEFSPMAQTPSSVQYIGHYFERNLVMSDKKKNLADMHLLIELCILH